MFVIRSLKIIKNNHIFIPFNGIHSVFLILCVINSIIRNFSDYKCMQNNTFIQIKIRKPSIVGRKFKLMDLVINPVSKKLFAL